MRVRIYALAKQLKVDNKKVVNAYKRLGFKDKKDSLAILADEESHAIAQQLGYDDIQNDLQNFRGGQREHRIQRKLRQKQRRRQKSLGKQMIPFTDEEQAKIGKLCEKHKSDIHIEVEMKKQQMIPSTRWKKRFYEYCHAFGGLREALEKMEYSDLERDGVTQRFEFAFELSCRVFNAYLQFNDIILTELTLKKIIEKCTTAKIFEEAGIKSEVFLRMLHARNALSHASDFEKYKKTFPLIKESFFVELEKAYHFFLNRMAVDTPAEVDDVDILELKH